MEPRPRPSFQPAGAGALLVATTVVATGIGALIGWMIGNTGVGVIAGAVVGIPAGAFVVYFRYREFLS